MLCSCTCLLPLPFAHCCCCTTVAAYLCPMADTCVCRSGGHCCTGFSSTLIVKQCECVAVPVAWTPSPTLQQPQTLQSLYVERPVCVCARVSGRSSVTVSPYSSSSSQAFPYFRCFVLLHQLAHSTPLQRSSCIKTSSLPLLGSTI